MVYSLCLGYMKGQTEMAQDLTQEIFINVWKALPNFRQEASPKTWIYRISVNTCLLHLRKFKRMQADHISESHESIPQEATNKDDFDELYYAIGQLPEVDRIIITLVLDEVKYDEMATILGIAEGTLRVRIHRIKQKLNDLMTNNGR